ncbi:transcriptional regulator with XRE-family HTH domain [Microbacterium resistens]|uniref:Transcriptional regulator with XRE-family HTH domain n=1 Tax=Microbacterium resistens TaxID=156977 RepID=A0ABU1SH59_9MICO|nr:helix-turn-helix transcriptional regulator [Microbacterium resistens]MDR6868936.1 transcriptional regulator with XRE-family HTH domain [Microbacterium resistens]
MVTDGKRESQAVAAQIRAERAAGRMTIDELSQASGVPRQTLVRYLKGSRDIPIPTFYAIAEGLGVAADVLLDRAQHRDAQS